MSFIPSDTFVTSIIGIIVSIMSVGLPISIGIISDKLSVYQNKRISNIYKEEKSFVWMKRIPILLIVPLLLSFFFYFKDDNGNGFWLQNILTSIILVCGIFCSCLFFCFLKVLISYATDMDSKIFEKIKVKIANESSTDEKMALLESLNLVAIKKEKSGSYDINDIFLYIMEQVLLICKETKGEEKSELRDKVYAYFSDTMFQLWKKSYKENMTTATFLTNNYIGAVKQMYQYEKDLRGVIFNPYIKIAGEMNKTNEDKTNYLSTPWVWYFNLVFSDDSFNTSYLESANDYLFQIIRDIIKANNLSVFDEFVNEANKILARYETQYEFPYSHDEDTKDTEDTLSDIKKLMLKYDKTSFEEAKKKAKSIKAENIGMSVKKLEFYITFTYKLHRFQILFSVIGAYCMALKKIPFLQGIFNLSEQRKTQFFLGKIMIYPTGLQPILGWKEFNLLFVRYFRLWEGKGDPNNWFGFYMSLIICSINIKPLEFSGIEDKEKMIKKIGYFQNKINELDSNLLKELRLRGKEETRKALNGIIADLKRGEN